MSAAAPAERRRRQAPVHNKTQTVTCEKRTTFYILSELTEGFPKKKICQKDFLKSSCNHLIQNSDLRN